MAKSQESFNKQEKEKQRAKKRDEKAQKKLERKSNNKDSSFESMIAYMDENGNITSTPPDPTKKKVIKAEDIEIGVPKRREETPEESVKTGTITFFNDSKGFGFIKDAKTGDSIFTHINGHLEKLKENDKVSFEVEPGMKGPTAVRVKLVK